MGGGAARSGAADGAPQPQEQQQQVGGWGGALCQAGGWGCGEPQGPQGQGQVERGCPPGGERRAAGVGGPGSSACGRMGVGCTQAAGMPSVPPSWGPRRDGRGCGGGRGSRVSAQRSGARTDGQGERRGRRGGWRGAGGRAGGHGRVRRRGRGGAARRGLPRHSPGGSSSGSRVPLRIFLPALAQRLERPPNPARPGRFRPQHLHLVGRPRPRLPQLLIGWPSRPSGRYGLRDRRLCKSGRGGGRTGWLARAEAAPPALSPDWLRGP